MENYKERDIKQKRDMESIKKESASARRNFFSILNDFIAGLL